MSRIRRDIPHPFIKVCRMWSMTPNFWDDDTTTNSQASEGWSPKYHKTEVPASQEPSQGKDSPPIFVTTTHLVDCSVQGRENHMQGQQGMHRVST